MNIRSTKIKPNLIILHFGDVFEKKRNYEAKSKHFRGTWIVSNTKRSGSDSRRN